MKPDQADREMFVYAVMEDVPSIDYDRSWLPRWCATRCVRCAEGGQRPVQDAPRGWTGSTSTPPDGLNSIYTKLRCRGRQQRDRRSVAAAVGAAHRVGQAQPAAA